MNLSLHQTLLKFLVYVRQSWMTQFIFAISLSLSVCVCVCVCVCVFVMCVCVFVWHLSFIQKDSVTRMHSLPVYLREGLPFARDLSL